MKTTKKPITRFKFMRTGLKSDNGKKVKWKIGKWRKEKNIKICERGFHCSKTPLRALSYVQGEVLAIVEVKGKGVVEQDKECYPEMRVLEAWNWTKEDSVALAVFAAEQVLSIFEKKYPKDKRPRKAILAAKNYLKAVKSGEAKKIEKARTYSAHAAAAAAHAAASPAYSAAHAAAAAHAYSAAHAAAAAYSAAYAAYTSSPAASAVAASPKLIAKIDKWFLERISKLTKYEQ
jgi:hypothetical protein